MPTVGPVGGIAGVLLAAGSSRRLGRSELPLPVDGEPLARRVMRRAAEAGLDPVLVVMARVEKALGGLPYEAVQDYERPCAQPVGA